MIKCNEIKQEADELKMKMNACTRLEATDMKRILDLILAINNCDGVTPVEPAPIIHSFQFDNLIDDISSTSIIDDIFISNYATEEQEADYLVGKPLVLTTVGRYGFIIEGAGDIPYQVLDQLGNDVTNIVFESHYSNDTDTYYYVSKEYAAPSSPYFKFIKN